MNILMLHIAYNELNLLKYKLKHCKRNNIDLYVIDNMSNDGTDKWLIKNKVPHSFIDTDNSFDLRPLCAAMTEKIHELKPSWVIYAGVDMFHEAWNGFSEMIMKADEEGYTQIRMKQYVFERTEGQEDKKGNPFRNYFYFQPRGSYVLISKYHESINIVPDGIERADAKIKDCQSDGIVFEMHASKSISERMECLKRRQKAWENGLQSDMGFHLFRHMKHDFTFQVSSCYDIRNFELYELYKRLQSL